MIDPDVIYAQIAVVRNHPLPAETPWHNMYEIVLVAHWVAQRFDLPGRLPRAKLEEVVVYVARREPTPDLYLSFHEWPSQPDLEFGYTPDVYNALMNLTPSNRFYKDLV